MSTRRRLLTGGLVLIATLLTPPPAGADIGITHVSPTSAAPGKSAKVEIGCGWPRGCPRRIPISLVPLKKAPEPRPCTVNRVSGVCTPISSETPREPPYIPIGGAHRTKGGSCGPWAASIVACYELRFHVPTLRTGTYAFVLYTAYPGSHGKGALITETHEHKNLRVQSQPAARASDDGNPAGIWAIAVAGGVAILAAGLVLRQRPRPRAAR